MYVADLLDFSLVGMRIHLWQVFSPVGVHPSLMTISPLPIVEEGMGQENVGLMPESRHRT